MDVASLLTPERTRCGVEVSSKKRALEALSQLLVTDAKPGADASRSVFEGLTVRERLGSTGLGRGVALPHSRHSGIEQPQAALIRLTAPIDFDAIDRQPVDLLFALLVPEHSNDEHLRILSRLAEMFRDEALCQQLRSCESHDQLYAAFTQWQSPGQ